MVRSWLWILFWEGRTFLLFFRLAGYGKSLIYQCFVHAKLNWLTGSPSIIVICPLKSIVQEQLKSNEFGLKAVELSRNKEVTWGYQASKYQVIYASAEEVLGDYFLAMPWRTWKRHSDEICRLLWWTNLTPWLFMLTLMKRNSDAAFRTLVG